MSHHVMAHEVFHMGREVFHMGLGVHVGHMRLEVYHMVIAMVVLYLFDLSCCVLLTLY